MALTQYGSISDGDVHKVVKNLINALNRMVVRTTVPLANAANQTLTASQMLGGNIIRSGGAALTDTTDTAANIVAAGPGTAVNDVAHMTIQNGNSGTLTLAAGTGVTLAGTTTIPAGSTRDYTIEFTNVTKGAEAVTVRGMRVATS